MSGTSPSPQPTRAPQRGRDPRLAAGCIVIGLFVLGAAAVGGFVSYTRQRPGSSAGLPVPAGCILLVAGLTLLGYGWLMWQRRKHQP